MIRLDEGGVYEKSKSGNLGFPNDGPLTDKVNSISPDHWKTKRTVRL